MERIYLDHAATTPLSKEAFDAMYPYFSNTFGNANSQHGFGRDGAAAVLSARESIASSLGAKPNEIYFTSGGTESDNWALKGTALALRDKGNHIITSKIEHSAIYTTCKQLEKYGYDVTYLDVDSDGFVSPSDLEKAITDNGGDVWYNSEVVKFLYNEDGSCAGVQLKSGEKICAKEIISNVIPNNVYAMSDVKYVPEKELRLANSRTLGLSFVTVYLGMDCSKEELGVEDYTTFISTYANPRECYNHRNEGAYYVVNCHNVAIPDASPEGTCMLFYTIPMMEEDFPKDLKPEEYKKWKNSVAKRFIEDSEKVLGIGLNPRMRLLPTTPVRVSAGPRQASTAAAGFPALLS